VGKKQTLKSVRFLLLQMFPRQKTGLTPAKASRLKTQSEAKSLRLLAAAPLRSRERAPEDLFAASSLQASCALVL
jgi:hypothetical protein